MNLTPLHSEKLKVNTFGNGNSKVTTVQRVNFLIKTDLKKIGRDRSVNYIFICLSLRNQLLQIARKHFEHLNLNFVDEGNLTGD